MKEVKIKISERDIDPIIRIGLKPWTKITDNERKEFDRLISYYGTAVIQKVIANE